MAVPDGFHGDSRSVVALQFPHEEDLGDMGAAPGRDGSRISFTIYAVPDALRHTMRRPYRIILVPDNRVEVPAVMPPRCRR